MVGQKRNLLLIDKLGRGVLYPFPSNFQLPASKIVGEHQTEFFLTDRVKTVEGEPCPIYTQGKNSNLDLNLYADPINQETSPIAPPKSSAERLDNIRDILEKQITFYKEYTEKEDRGEVDSSYVYDTMRDQFNDLLSSGDFVNIIKELSDD